MKKQLLIIGSYLDAEVKKDILRKNINTLRDDFDILISSHYPVDVEFQNNTRYVVYNSNNDLKKCDGFIVWYRYNNVYQQWYYDASYNPSYAVYQLIRPAVLFAKSLGYESFLYMEGDMSVSKTDSKKLMELKEHTVLENKRACFFNGLMPWWDCQLFYSEIDFFIHNTPALNSFDEFTDYSNKIGSKNFLEALLYKLLYTPNEQHIREIPLQVQSYMNNSLLNLTEVNNGFKNNKIEMSEINSAEEYIQYTINVLKLQNTDRIFLSYRKISSTFPKLDVYVNDTLCLSVRDSTEFMVVEIFPSDEFNIKLVHDGKLVKESTLTKENILTTPDFIKFE